MLITLKAIQHENKTGRSGKAYVSCKLIVAGRDGAKDVWITGFGSDITKTWQAGDIVDVNTVQTDRGYWNFEENENSKPSPDKKLALLNEINAKLDLLLAGGLSHTTSTEKNATIAGFQATKSADTPPVDDIPEFLR
jgi:hypothetical protein